MRASEVAIMPDISAAHPTERGSGTVRVHARPGAAELAMVDLADLVPGVKSFHDPASSAMTDVSLRTRDLIQAVAADADRNTAGRMRPASGRCLANLAAIRAPRFSGFLAT